MKRTIDPTRARAALFSISLVAAVASVTAMAPAHAARIGVPAAPGRPQVIATIPLGGRIPLDIATDPVARRAYVTEPHGVTVINERTNKTIATIHIPARSVSVRPGILLAFARNVATDPLTGMVYVTDTQHSSVLVISGRTDKVVATIKVGGAAYWVATNPLTDKVYVQVLQRSGDVVAVIDGRTNTLVAEIPEPGPDWAGIAVNPVTDTLYVGGGSAAGMLVINGRTNKVTTTIPGVGAWSVAADPAANTIYAAYPGGEGFGVVSVIDGQTTTLTHSITVQAPVRIATDPLTHLAYATNLYPDNVVVINGRTGKVAASVRVGKQPLGIATDPLTNTVYVANIVSRSVTVLAGSR